MEKFVPFLAYEASAGSGKTFNLVVRYLSLLFMGEDPRRVMALTFTNKAANEMMERIIHTLKELDKRGELPVIAQLTGFTEEEILRKRGGILKTFLSSDVQISTIDRFFGSVLRKFALHAGIMPTFSPVQAHHHVQLLERFLHEIEVGGKSSSLVRLALLSQKRVNDLFGLLEMMYVKHKEFDSLHYPKNDKIGENLIKTAMNAMRELKALVQSKGLSKTANEAVEVQTYEELIEKTWVYKESLNYWVFKKGFESKMDQYLQVIQNAIKEQMERIEEEFFYELFNILQLYIKSRKALIKESNELTFDDITLMVHSLLREELDSEFLYFRLDARLKHLLLDEFQDTSTLQFDILRPLIDEVYAGKGVKEGGSFFFVGDVKQSIYRFRGGVSALFYEVAHHYGVHVEPLKINYRSRYEIVHFVNSLFEAKIEGYVHQEVLDKQAGGYVEVVMGEELLMEAEKIVQGLLEKGVDSNEIAILCATNSDGSAIEEHLTEAGYDVVTETTARLISQRYVRALIEYLRYCYFREEIYRHNCAALVGVDPMKIEIEAIHEVLEVCIRFCRRWGIMDKSVIVFLELLGNYQDIEEVVFTIDRMEAVSPQSDLQGIRVMTVHKSKGLEFGHVIVMDKLGQNRNRSDTILFEYDGVHLKRLFYRMSGRDALDQAYAKALEKEKKLTYEDQLNALYVAMTRAVESLHVVSKTKNSWLEPLALNEGKWGIFQQKERILKPVNALQPCGFMGIVFGSQEGNVLQEKEEDFDHEAILFGSALHYTLEMMGEFSIHSLDQALVSTYNRFAMSISEKRIEEIYKRIKRLLEDGLFIRLCRGECYREQSLQYEGRIHIIDLLVRHEDRWVIIDYKTGLGIGNKHIDQVKRYMQTVYEVTSEPTEGYVCYLLEDRIEWVKCL